jgi:hypothetical protein
MLLGLAAALLLANGSKAEEMATDAEGKFVRVGGNYVVAAVKQENDNTFLVTFKAEVASGKFDELRLASDHVHVAVKVGKTLRLSAEVVSTSGPVAEISQVVLFFPSAESHVPVWLMSNKFPARDLKASRYLEMHAPINDFMIL